MQTFTLINTGASSDATLIVNKGCRLFGVDCMNNSSSAVAYLKFYDTHLTPTTVMTPVRRYMIPTGGGLVRLFDNQPLQFTDGLAFLIAGGIADADNTNATASTLLINIDWN